MQHAATASNPSNRRGSQAAKIVRINKQEKKQKTAATITISCGYEQKKTPTSSLFNQPTNTYNRQQAWRTKKK
jgi:hypothetical protein